MLDDFFVRALLAGVGVALVAGPFGCFIVWRGLAYYGDTLSHSALLGIALGIMLNINLTISVFLVAGLGAVCLLFLQNRRGMSADSMLGLLSHTALACGLVVLAAIGSGRIDLPAFLFGPISVTISAGRTVRLMPRINQRPSRCTPALARLISGVCVAFKFRPLTGEPRSIREENARERGRLSRPDAGAASQRKSRERVARLPSRLVWSSTRRATRCCTSPVLSSRCQTP